MAITSGTGVSISFAGYTAITIDVKDRVGSVASLEVTPVASVQKQFIPAGARDNGQCVVTCGFEPTSNQIPVEGTVAQLTVTYPDLSTAVFPAAFLQEVDRPRLHGDEPMLARLTFKLSTKS